MKGDDTQTSIDVGAHGQRRRGRAIVGAGGDFGWREGGGASSEIGVGDHGHVAGFRVEQHHVIGVVIGNAGTHQDRRLARGGRYSVEALDDLPAVDRNSSEASQRVRVVAAPCAVRRLQFSRGVGAGIELGVSSDMRTAVGTTLGS